MKVINKCRSVGMRSSSSIQGLRAVAESGIPKAGAAAGSRNSLAGNRRAPSSSEIEFRRKPGSLGQQGTPSSSNATQPKLSSRYCSLFCHYGLKLKVSKISNFPLLNPSQIAPKFYSLVEQCRAKNSTRVEADSI